MSLVDENSDTGMKGMSERSPRKSVSLNTDINFVMFHFVSFRGSFWG